MNNQKGMLIDVYYNKKYRHCANGGISEHHEELLLVGDDIPQIFEADGCPMVTIETVFFNGGSRDYLSPVDKIEGKHYMAGGNFGYTSDSRVLPVPLSIHDRTES